MAASKKTDKRRINEELTEFIKSSPSPFHSVRSIADILNDNGFSCLSENSAWELRPGRYYVCRGGSSIAAFDIPERIRDYHFQICAVHGDSPTYKIKANPEMTGPGDYLRLDTEGYGGMIDYTWLDRPLSVAGRVFADDGGKVVSKLYYADEDMLIIPSLAIHMNREVNKGYCFNRQVDLAPMMSAGELREGSLYKRIAKSCKIKAENILSAELFLVNRQDGVIWGKNDEFISAPKLDDLQAAFVSAKAFAQSKNPGCINVFVCFDNEEVGSRTKQGAMSTFLSDVLTRISCSLGKSAQDHLAALAGSFVVSFDNAHAVHPNHPEKSDAVNAPYINKGIVIKENAAQSYTTDAFSRAVFKQICKDASVPVQVFANRSDMTGGGTLGNISNIQVSVHSVDIGIAQLAMHSSFETAGCTDTVYAFGAMKQYYSSLIRINGSETFSVIE